MSTSNISIQSAPRDPNELLKIKRGILYRLALQLNMFPSDDQDQAFLAADHGVQAQAVAQALMALDANGAGQPAPGTPQMPTVVAPPAAQMSPVPMQQPMQQMQVPTQVPTQMGQPVVPQMNPAQMPAQAFGGQMQIPQMPVNQFQPMQAQAPMPPQPSQAPSQLAGLVPPVRQPSTVSDPTNAGARPQAPPGVDATTAINAGAIFTRLDNHDKAFKQVTETTQSILKWVEEAHNTALGAVQMQRIIIRLLLTIIEQQQGIDLGMLLKLMKQQSDEDINTIIQTFASAGKGKG